MAHIGPPRQDLHCLQIQLFSSLVLEELLNLIMQHKSKTNTKFNRHPEGVCQMLYWFYFHNEFMRVKGTYLHAYIRGMGILNLACTSLKCDKSLQC